MKKISPNVPCPCGSKNKYKKCCQAYHKGAKPKTALLLMKSRYTAYAVGNSAYIVNTTHENNVQYMEDSKAWKESIDIFCKETDFLGLEILAFIEGEEEAFVTFKALLSTGEMLEKSRFLKVEGRWLYENGEVS
ncbi:MAG TPA: zinc chelation protein SecC [Campylobacterales bacterium]|nr:zinc chelation protein SecC [Campylobacterales bacterium]